MKSSKRILAIVMIMAMVFSLVAINASAAPVEGTCGGCLWSIDANGTLIIKPDTTAADPGQLDSITKIDGWPWYSHTSDIKKVEIASGVKAGDSLAYMFKNCQNIESIDLSGLDTSKAEIMAGMFSNCTSLESIDLSTFNTANVMDMQYMFCQCSKLKSLDLSSFNTAKVETMFYMFALCPELTTIYVGDEWSIASVIDSTDMFYDSTKLVGGKGTTYDSNYRRAEYARVDAGSAAPGYLTKLYKIAQTEAELTWEKGCCDILTVTSNATYDLFVKILVDGTEVVEQDSSKDYKNYDIKSGSTKVIFTAGYLETLSVGKHSIEIVSEDGSAKGTFTIVEATKTEEPTTKKEETKTEEPTTKKEETKTEEKVADTADNNEIATFVALGTLAAAGFVTLKKKKTN